MVSPPPPPLIRIPTRKIRWQGRQHRPPPVQELPGLLDDIMSGILSAWAILCFGTVPIGGLVYQRGWLYLQVRRFVIAWVSGDGFFSGIYGIHLMSSFCWHEGLDSCRHGFAGLPAPLLPIISIDQWGREVAYCYCHPDFLPFWLLRLILPLTLLMSVSDWIIVKDWWILVKVGGVEGWGCHFDSWCCNNIEMLLWLCNIRKRLTRKWLVKVGGVKHLGHVEGLL